MDNLNRIVENILEKDIFNLKEASELLEMDENDLLNAVNKKDIKYHFLNKDIAFHPRDLDAYYNKKKIYEKYKPLAPYFFILEQHKLLEDCLNEFHLKEAMQMRIALNRYNRIREDYLEDFQLTKRQKQNGLLNIEVMSRLRIEQPTILHSMISEKQIKTLRNKNNLLLITKKSFEKYLGKDIDYLYLNIREVSQNITKPVKKIAKAALKQNLGRMLPGNNYIFTEEEAYIIQNILT